MKQRRHMVFRLSLGSSLALVLLVGCWDGATPPANPSGAAPPAPGHAGLHNVLTINDKLLSGSGPEGDAGFRSLRDLGVQTIISVDGATPDVEAARRHGLRYVHLPIGYDGVPRGQALRIARAVRDLPGKAYIHCHHGKHRGPAATAAVALCLDGQLRPEDALALLRKAGTDPHYTGLYSSVESFRRPTPEEWANVSNDFPESAKISALAEMMVAIDERWDRLKAVRAAGWRPPPGHADLDPPHEALQLRQRYREAGRLPDVQARPEEMQSFLRESEAAAGNLEAALRAADRVAAERHFQRLQAACQQCHGRYRDAPREQ